MPMPTELVFNELSFENSCQDTEQARLLMSNFIDLLKYLSRKSFYSSLRTARDFFSGTISTGYTVNNWISDDAIPKELRLYLQRLGKKLSFIEDMNQNTFQQRELLCEYRFQQKLARGLGYAHFTSSIALSLQSHPCWDKSAVDISIKEINTDGSIEEYSDAVLHASQCSHGDEHELNFQSILFNSVSSGKDLWEQRIELFPALIFCSAVNDQISTIMGSALTQIKKRLAELNSKAGDSVFNPSMLKHASRESETRLNKYGSELHIYCPDGEKKLFNWHTRATPGALRIYFEHLPHAGKFLIGYVGKKLGS